MKISVQIPAYSPTNPHVVKRARISDELRRNKEKDYKVIFRKWNRVYAIEYEMLVKSYLASLAQNLSGKQIVEKGKILEILSKYKNGKHAEVFRSLIPQIRNSIQHADYVIDPKKPIITFHDRKKPPLSLTIEEYNGIMWESFFLVLAFDIATFDIEFGLYQYLIGELDFLQEFIKKHDLKITKNKEAPLSLFDWATLLKSGKVKT